MLFFAMFPKKKCDNKKKRIALISNRFPAHPPEKQHTVGSQVSKSAGFNGGRIYWPGMEIL